MILTVSTLQNPEEEESGSLSDPGLGNFIFPGLSRGPSHSPHSDPVNCLLGLRERGYHVAEKASFCEFVQELYIPEFGGSFSWFGRDRNPPHLLCNVVGEGDRAQYHATRV